MNDDGPSNIAIATLHDAGEVNGVCAPFVAVLSSTPVGITTLRDHLGSETALTALRADARLQQIRIADVAQSSVAPCPSGEGLHR